MDPLYLYKSLFSVQLKVSNTCLEELGENVCNLEDVLASCKPRELLNGLPPNLNTVNKVDECQCSNKRRDRFNISAS